METLDDWVTRVAGGKSHRQIAADLGVGHGVFSRWIRESTFPINHLLAFSRFYRASFLEALCVAEYATEAELALWAPHVSLRRASELELVTELQRRLVARDILEEDDASLPAQEPEPRLDRTA